MSTNKPNILLVEDEENLHSSIKLNFELEGYEVTSAFNGAEALTALNTEYFDLIVLDIMLPEVDGLSVAETTRLNNIETPILMLSAKSSGNDRVIGLKKGADDYLTKPFNLEELLLRVSKLIKKNTQLKSKPVVASNYSFGNNTIDFNAQEATTYNNQKISLSKKETMLLKLLIDNRGEIVTREKILQIVWGYNVYPTTRTIDNFILNFRKYFELDTKNPKHFFSARGVGYRFVD